MDLNTLRTPLMALEYYHHVYGHVFVTIGNTTYHYSGYVGEKSIKITQKFHFYSMKATYAII